jgi:hypothetical protein
MDGHELSREHDRADIGIRRRIEKGHYRSDQPHYGSGLGVSISAAVTRRASRRC